jgi:hypothetical protein
MDIIISSAMTSVFFLQILQFFCVILFLLYCLSLTVSPYLHYFVSVPLRQYAGMRRYDFVALVL